MRRTSTEVTTSTSLIGVLGDKEWFYSQDTSADTLVLASWCTLSTALHLIALMLWCGC